MSAARTRWGWHRLRDSYARRLVREAGVRPGELVVDLGAGTGAITRRLLEAGAVVIAVELHPQRAAVLRERYGGPACRVVHADAVALRLPDRRFRVVANPPFAVLTQLLRRITSGTSGLRQADLVVPVHVAARWSRGAAPLPARFRAATVRRLPPEAFDPAAAGPAAVLRIERRHRR